MKAFLYWLATLADDSLYHLDDEEEPCCDG